MIVGPVTMMGAALLLVQAAAPAGGAPDPAAAVTVQAASPRSLSGRFTCGAVTYELQLTAAPATGNPVMLDRLTAGGKPVDAGVLAEVRRMAARLADAQSLDVRCRSDGTGELSIYGTQGVAGAAPRRARLRGILEGGRISALTVAVQR